MPSYRIHVDNFYRQVYGEYLASRPKTDPVEEMKKKLHA